VARSQNRMATPKARR